MIPYLTFDPAKSRVTITSATIQYPALVMHIIFAFIALVTGFLQFIERIRLKSLKIHRNIGKAYVMSVLISDLLAFVVICYVEDFTKALSVLTLAVLWLFTTWKGYRKAVKKRFNEHRIWMIRSFGITLVAVSASLLVPVLLLCFVMLS
ncbi:DUF2306 domain-containing protein [Pseudalkalibacillus decolorationis]|uniref:DUF2306 domain-containing protein n=1 Tax=Pseudalkalibacillus decolorationis TaxID=163879 RepID=UPI0021474BEA|nr:DUF2306 domain-containing protein [Pseudalkalibacillus decolorationis]